MVAIIPTGIGILAAALASLLVFRPRLPQFSFQVQSIYPTLLHDSTPAFNIGANIKLYNGNYITAAVHAFTFDLYYPDWEDKLSYIGQVTDVKQKQKQPVVENNNSTKMKNDDKAIWILSPRMDFEVIDDVVMVPTNAGTKVFSSLSWDVFKKSGIIQIPLSGVFHIKANGKIKLSMSMICDNNILDTWKMEFQGVSCHMDFVGVGWTNLTKESERLRSKIINTTWRADDYPITPVDTSEEEDTAVTVSS